MIDAQSLPDRIEKAKQNKKYYGIPLWKKEALMGWDELRMEVKKKLEGANIDYIFTSRRE